MKRDKSMLYDISESQLYSMNRDELLSLGRFMTSLYDEEMKKGDEERKNYGLIKSLGKAMNLIGIIYKKKGPEWYELRNVLHSIAKDVLSKLN